jgi:hypothetical protein
MRYEEKTTASKPGLEIVAPSAPALGSPHLMRCSASHFCNTSREYWKWAIVIVTSTFACGESSQTAASNHSDNARRRRSPPHPSIPI